MGLTRYEQETIVNYNNGDKIASVYTADPIVIRKLDALVEKYPEDYKCIEQNDYSKTYEFPKKLVQFRHPIHLTEEQKEESRQRFMKISKHKKGNES